jgi:hypothetical protein
MFPLFLGCYYWVKNYSSAGSSSRISSSSNFAPQNRQYAEPSSWPVRPHRGHRVSVWRRCSLIIEADTMPVGTAMMV